MVSLVVMNCTEDMVGRGSKSIRCSRPRVSGLLMIGTMLFRRECFKPLVNLGRRAESDRAVVTIYAIGFANQSLLGRKCNKKVYFVDSA